MATLLVQGIVQIWNGKTGMSKTQSSFIEAVVGNKEIKMVLYLDTGKIKSLQLYNNVKDVMRRTYEDQNYLHLTFQNNDFLFIEKLSTPDAKQLKVFLDRVCKNKIKPSIRHGKGRAGASSTATWEMLRNTAVKKFSGEASDGSFAAAIKSEPSVPRMPLLKSNTSPLTSEEISLKKQCRKRKRILSMSKKNDKKFLEKNDSRRKEELESNSSMPVNDKGEKQTQLRKSGKDKSAREFSLGKNCTGDPSFSGAGPKSITKVVMPFPLEKDSVTGWVKWNEIQKSLFLCPQKAWQGFPNVGNTCYINVVLQALCSVPLFINDLFNQGFPWVKLPSDEFNMHLMQLLVLKDVYNVKMKEKLLINIKKALPAYGEIFAIDRQNDAHEFLSLCLVQLKETIEKLNSIWDISNEFGGNNSFQRAFMDYAHTEMLACPVSSNFEFELLSSIFCKACGTIVFKREPSSNLSVNLPQGMKAQTLSIQSSLDLFFRAEEIEHTCEKCKHNRSVVVQKFSMLPRVLIVHLKRYTFNESLEVTKDEQNVIISKYLKLSCHCDKNTRPPHPLSKNGLVKDTELITSLYEMKAETISSPLPSSSKSENFPGVHVGLNHKSDPQNLQRLTKRSRRQQQKELGKHSVPNVRDSELTDEDNGIFAKLKKLEEMETFVMSDFETSKYKMPQIQETFQVPQKAQKCEEKKKHREALQRALFQSLPEPNVRGQTKNLRSQYTESNPKNVKLHSQCSLQSPKTIGNKPVFDQKRKSKAKEPKRSALKESSQQIYRLIDVISHLGSSPHGGHYINDAYDFRKKMWFNFSDLQVSSIREDHMQKARLSTGYVFFYMYNEFFEKLLAQEKNSKSDSTSQED